MAQGALALAVALTSAATVAYEVLLVRLLAIEQFHHFAYLAIGVAMLGGGASGTVLALWAPAEASRPRALRWAAATTALALVAAPVVARQVRLDATQLVFSLAQWPRLFALIGLVALPFACGGAATLLAITSAARTGLSYGASFVGGGAGVLLALAALSRTTPGHALLLPAALAAAGALLFARWPAPTARAPFAVSLGALAACSIFLLPSFEPRPSAYKALPQIEAMPGARVTLERTSAIGWVVAVQADAFRYAPGLSLGYRGGFPRQTALLVDGELVGAVSHFDGGRELLDWLPTALPYALGTVESALLLCAGSGLEVETALRHGATSVVAVELHPELAALQAPAGGAWRIGDARSAAARGGERFDLISIGPASGPGASAAGVHALAEDHLHTVEAYGALLSRLTPRGTLAVTRWMSEPPRESLRTLLTAAEALRSAGHEPGASLVVARSWATATVLARPAGFTHSEVDRLRRWAESRFFDLDWYPGARGPPAEPFNALDDPALYRAAAAAAAGREQATRLAASSPFEVAPVDDARPYPHHFLRLRSLPALLRSGALLPFAEWGPIAVLATLALSVLWAVLLLLLPALLATRLRRARPSGAALVYFAALGFGYLAAELAVIQQLGLLLGHPVYAVAAALATFLVCSGLGSGLSDRLAAARAAWPCAAAAALLAAFALLLLALVERLQPAPLALRAALGMACAAPLALALGMPFSLGLRRLAGGDASAVGWAWAANGFASVMAAPLSALLAAEAGSRALLAAAAAAYAIAAASSARLSPEREPGRVS